MKSYQPYKHNLSTLAKWAGADTQMKALRAAVHAWVDVSIAGGMSKHEAKNAAWSAVATLLARQETGTEVPEDVKAAAADLRGQFGLISLTTLFSNLKAEGTQTVEVPEA